MKLGLIIATMGCRWWLTSLLAWSLLPATVPAALVQSGNVSPNVADWTISTNGYIGITSDGSVKVDSGSLLVSQYARLGVEPDSTGAVTVTGAGSRWTSGALYGERSTVSDLVIGQNSHGVLTVEAGGQVSSYLSYVGTGGSSTGTATVTGAGSKWTNKGWLYVGTQNNGTLTVSDGGEVVAGTLLASLSDLQGDGTITATGAVLDADLVFDAAHGASPSLAFGSGGTLSAMNGGALGAGYKQSGTVTICEGIAVSSIAGYLGYGRASTGTALVTGAGSKWTNTQLRVGEYGAGALTIEAGGQVSSAYSYLGHELNSTGAVRVTGAGSKWTAGELYVGRSGSGMLTIEAGGRISSSSSQLGLYDSSTSAATVTGVGSEWAISGNLTVNRGALTIEAGGLVSVRIKLSIENTSAAINMATGGMLALYGNADDSLSQFLGLVQGTDAIRFWDDALAAWTPLASATFDEDYTLEYLTTGDLAGYTLLAVGEASIPGLAGDFNADGSVDGADFLAWQRGESPDPLGEDALTAWKTNFGTSPPGPASSLAVPEPTAGALALLLPLAGRLCQAASNRRRLTTAL